MTFITSHQQTHLWPAKTGSYYQPHFSTPEVCPQISPDKILEYINCKYFILGFLCWMKLWNWNITKVFLTMWSKGEICPNTDLFSSDLACTKAHGNTWKMVKSEDVYWIALSSIAWFETNLMQKCQILFVFFKGLLDFTLFYPFLLFHLIIRQHYHFS